MIFMNLHVHHDFSNEIYIYSLLNSFTWISQNYFDYKMLKPEHITFFHSLIFSHISSLLLENWVTQASLSSGDLFP